MARITSNTFINAGSECDEEVVSLQPLYEHSGSVMNILGEEGKQEWNSLITNELRQGRPIIISGKSEKDRHIFILDGLKDNLGARESLVGMDVMTVTIPWTVSMNILKIMQPS
jgi:hypothetical protein